MKDQEIRRQLQAGRKNQNQGGIVSAHLNASGLSTPRSGDDEAPYTKLNPFVTPAESYWRQQELPDAAASYIDGPVIDVAQWRTLTVYVICPGRLSLLPQASPDLVGDTDTFTAAIDPDRTPLIPIGVIDPTLTAITVPSPPIPAAFASRTVYATELRNPAATDFAATLAFDVTMYSAFNFRAAELAPGEDPSRVTLTYSLSM